MWCSFNHLRCFMVLNLRARKKVLYYSYFGSFLMLKKFRLWRSFGSGSGSGSRQYLAQFSKNKKLHKILPYNVRSSLLPRIWPLVFDFFDFFYYILCWIRIHIRFRNRNQNRFRFRLPNTVRNLNSQFIFAAWSIFYQTQATCAEHCTLLVRKWRGSNPGLFIHTFDRVRAPQSEWRNHRRGMRRAGTGWMSAKPEVEVILLTYTAFFWWCSADFAGISLVQKELDFLGSSAGN